MPPIIVSRNATTQNRFAVKTAPADRTDSASSVTYMLASQIETYVTLWDAETAGYAVPVNFLLQPESIAALIQASGANTRVAPGPHPQLDIWEKALELRDQICGLILVRVSPPGAPDADGIIDFSNAIAAQPNHHLIFGAPRGGRLVYEEKDHEQEMDYDCSRYRHCSYRRGCCGADYE